MVQIQSMEVKESILVDLGACLNTIFFKKLLYVELGKVEKSVQSIRGSFTTFLGKVHLELKVGQIIC